MHESGFMTFSPLLTLRTKDNDRKQSKNPEKRLGACLAVECKKAINIKFNVWEGNEKKISRT